MSKLHLEARRWLKSHRKTHPFLAVSASFIPPHEHCTLQLCGVISRETAFNVRTWAFIGEAERDLFVSKVSTAEKAGRQ